jgi:hypothetical protein
MSRREKLGVVSTAFGAVNRPVLEALRDSFDTQQLLELVDQLDELRSRICDPEGLRADLLRVSAGASGIAQHQQHHAREREGPRAARAEHAKIHIAPRHQNDTFCNEYTARPFRGSRISTAGISSFV